MVDGGEFQVGAKGGVFFLLLRVVVGKLLLPLHPPLALTAKLTQGATAGLLSGLRNLTEDHGLPEEAATACGGKTKVGLTKGFWGETLGLGAREGETGVQGCSSVEGREEMGVMVLELVGDVGGALPLVETVKGVGGRGG